MQNSNSTTSIESSLSATQKFNEEETKIKEKAQQLKEKLMKARKKKEEEMEKKIKERMIDEYQKGFLNFKTQFQSYAESQTASLELVKEFRINEICDFEVHIQNVIRKLQKNLQQVSQKEAQLGTAHKQALNFLQAEEQKQIEEVKERLQIKKRQKIQEYKKRVDIE